MLTARQKTLLLKEHRAHETDTGSANVQIALLSKQIDELSGHLKKHAKDHHSRRGLLKMVSKRRKLLTYLAKHDPKGHAKLAKKLGLKR